MRRKDQNMKRSVPGLRVLAAILLLVVLSDSSTFSSRAVHRLRRETNDRGKEAVLIGESNSKMMKHHATTSINGEAADFSNAMGEMDEEEVCGWEEIGGEECRKRRMMADAHLDYIYTQRHSHP